MPPLPPPDLVTQHRFPGLQDGGGGAAVPAEGEAAGGAEVLPERPQAHLLEGPLRRHHVRRHPSRPGRLQLVPHRKQIFA